MSIKNGIVFILGSGSSVDSGLKTYRGENGLYLSLTDEEIYENLSINTFKKDPLKVWKFLSPLIKNIRENKPGKTYELIKNIVNEYKDSIILTQNIDGYCKESNCEIIELHGTYSKMECSVCNIEYDTNENNPYCSCGEICRPCIVLYGEELNPKISYKIFKLIKHKYKSIVVIGTTLTFSYLRKIINKCKHKGTPLVHINPDKEYIVEVKKKEVWIKNNSYEGLIEFMNVDKV